MVGCKIDEYLAFAPVESGFGVNLDKGADTQQVWLEGSKQDQALCKVLEPVCCSIPLGACRQARDSLVLEALGRLAHHTLEGTCPVIVRSRGCIWLGNSGIQKEVPCIQWVACNLDIRDCHVRMNLQTNAVVCCPGDKSCPSRLQK